MLKERGKWWNIYPVCLIEQTWRTKRNVGNERNRNTLKLRKTKEILKSHGGRRNNEHDCVKIWYGRAALSTPPLPQWQHEQG